MRPGQKFVWHHFGDGKGRKALQKTVDEHFPTNATGTLPGHVPNQEIMRHYREQPVDVFVNLSTTEGGAPVAIQEAISCGIPVIATNVGGNPEIVSDRNGLLLNPDPIPEEVAKALLTFCDNPEMAQKMRAESRKVWQESYNADVNFRAFAERLRLIAES
jgi:glycosyltransferase involved in cell wall biosynthesis